MITDGVEKQIIDEFARISPIAWGHILFEGRYSFKKSNGNIDVESMIEILEQQFQKYLLKKTLIRKSNFKLNHRGFIILV